MTIAELLARSAARIERFDARLLLEEACGIEPSRPFARPEQEVDAAACERFETMVARRERGEPVAYITGHVGFYGRTFCVDRRVLVPRPETELLVEGALDHLRTIPARRVRFVDVGTGSGAIAISVVAEDGRIDGVATDIAPEALAVARENAQRLGVGDRIAFAQGDLFEAAARLGPFDLVVANLPYIPSAEVPEQPHPVGFEPRIALDGGPDGLALYRRLLEGAPGVLAPGGGLFLEAAPGTIDALADAAETAFPDAGIEIGTDYAGLDRYVVVIPAGR